MQYSIKHVHYRFLPLICTAVTNKSLNTRRNIFQFLEQILHVWPLHILEVGKSFFKDLEFFMDLNHWILQKGIEPIQDALKIGLLDQDRETRSWSRKTFWAFADHFKLESDLLLGCLDRAVVLGTGDRDSASVVSGSGVSVRSRQSSVARSNESLDSLVSDQTRMCHKSIRALLIFKYLNHSASCSSWVGTTFNDNIICNFNQGHFVNSKQWARAMLTSVQ